MPTPDVDPHSGLLRLDQGRGTDEKLNEITVNGRMKLDLQRKRKRNSSLGWGGQLSALIDHVHFSDDSSYEPKNRLRPVVRHGG